jgi:putative Mn2+ efflux pump MntP
MLALFVLACGVAADATAVAIAAAIRGVSTRRGLLVACTFGLAQALMAALGWIGGALVGEVWARWDHWIALALLSAVGLKMIREALRDGSRREVSAEGLASIVVLAVATSLDALAVGVSLPALGVPAWVCVTTIGAVTLVSSAIAIAFGRYLGERFGRRMEIAGGLALIVIGIRIAIEHTRG